MDSSSLFLTITETHYTQCHKWKRHISHSHLNCQIPPGSLVLRGIGPPTHFTLRAFEWLQPRVPHPGKVLGFFPVLGSP